MRSRSWVTEIIFLAMLLAPATVRAADDSVPPCAPGVTVRNTPMQYQGEAGIWFHRDVARCLLTAVQERDELRLMIQDYEYRQAMQDDLGKILEKQRDLAVEEAFLAKASADDAIRARLAAEEKLSKPKRSPILWFSLGVIVAGSAAALTATLSR